MGFVAPVDPTTATVVSTSTFGRPVVDAINAMSNPARAQMYQTTTATTIANSTTTWTPVGFDTELADTANGHSTVTTPARYIAQTGWGGLYIVEAAVYFTGNATGLRLVGVGINGLTPQNGSITGFGTSPNSGTLAIQTSAEVLLAAGDYVQTLALQSSGGGLATVVGGLPITSSMSVRWVAAA